MPFVRANTKGKDRQTVGFKFVFVCGARDLFRTRRHPLMAKLHGIKSSNPLVAQMIAEQVFDNALVAAGLMDDSRVMLPR